MDIITDIRIKSGKIKRTIVLPESVDTRILSATKYLVEHELANIILLSSDEAGLKQSSAEVGLDIEKVKVIDPLTSESLKKYAQKFYELRQHKGVSEDDAMEQLRDFVYFGAMMVRHGDADGMVAGAITTTADVAKSAIYCIGFGEEVKTFSSCFLMQVPGSDYGENGVFVFADCGIIPDPKPAQLANIAKSSADLFQLLVGVEPRVALLSFSSKGSAEHPMVDKVINTKRIANEKFPDLLIDGEL